MIVFNPFNDKKSPNLSNTILFKEIKNKTLIVVEVSLTNYRVKFFNRIVLWLIHKVMKRIIRISIDRGYEW